MFKKVRHKKPGHTKKTWVSSSVGLLSFVVAQNQCHILAKLYPNFLDLYFWVIFSIILHPNLSICRPPCFEY